jgi:hypothetical protein
VASDSITVTTLNFAMPVSAFTIDTTSGCKPLTVNITNTSSNATSYHWIYSSGGFSDSVNPVRIYGYSVNDTITLIAYDSTVCGVFSDTSVQAFSFTVFTPPAQLVISYSDDTLFSSSLINNQWNLDSSMI